MTWVSGILTALVATVLIVAGCAPGPPEMGGPGPDELRPEGREWSCEHENGAAAERMAGVGESWAVDGGRMLSAHHTKEDPDGPPGLATREQAVEDAVGSATKAALDLLEHRGVSYDPVRRRSIVEEATRAAVRGDDVAFPRMDVLDRSWERCVAGAEGTEAGADTVWSAAVLVEYQIGLLRGDVRNALWERERASAEAAVLIASAEEHLASGRWHDGLLDAARAADVIRATGAPLGNAGLSVRAHAGAGDTTTDAPPDASAGPSIDDRLRTEFARSKAIGCEAWPIVAGATGGVDIIESGAHANVAVRFRCTYEWHGRTIPAVGVPVRFEMAGASAVMDADPLTDASGTASCRVLAAYGPPGEYALSLYLDTDAAAAALAGTLGPRTAQGTGAWTGLRETVTDAPLAGKSIHLVSGAHAITVCATFGEKADVDAAQVTAGFGRRMERDGFMMDDCGPDVNVVVTGRFSINTVEGPDAGIAEVILSASAFDQRTAMSLGETDIRSAQGFDTEAGDEGTRDAEVLALKEAGRLLAVYFGSRILASGI